MKREIYNKCGQVHRIKSKKINNEKCSCALLLHVKKRFPDEVSKLQSDSYVKIYFCITILTIIIIIIIVIIIILSTSPSSLLLLWRW